MLLHFGAVDYEATIYLNQIEVGRHTGGYQAFTLDITNALRSGDNELVVRVFDPSDMGNNPHGKQTLRPQGAFYTATSGIWQTVWLEAVPGVYIDSLSMRPNVDRNELNVDVQLGGTTAGTQTQDYSFQFIATSHSTVVASREAIGSTALHIDNPRLWSPEAPFLYGLRVNLIKQGRVVDTVESYFGMRKVEVKRDTAGIERIFLNDRPTYNLGLLDQGYWPDGLYTAPTDTALQFDIRAAKAMGFNTIRKHVKVEPDRWYYYCDKLGLLVWQDMVPPGNDSAAARLQFENEVAANLKQLHNHPSIITWVLFNEGWGAYEQQRLSTLVKTLDPSRLLDAHTGPNALYMDDRERALPPAVLSKVLAGDYTPVLEELGNPQSNDPTNWVGSDFTDVHAYPHPVIAPDLPGKARVLGEYGGVGVVVGGHTWDGLPGSGYMQVAPAELPRVYSGMMDELKALQAKGLSASIYTQPYDVEQEQNGLITYDRAVIKIPLEEIAKANAKVLPGANNYAREGERLSLKNSDLTPVAVRYATLLKAFKTGRSDLPFLQRLVVTALQSHNQEVATNAGRKFLEQLSEPYSPRVWRFIQETTRTSQDGGFELLRTRAPSADKILGKNAAENIVRQIIMREEIQPRLVHSDQPPDWGTVGTTVTVKYGVLGSEAAYGSAMMYYLERQDWAAFGRYFILYFGSAADRSEYSIADLAYVVFEYVDDSAVLAMAAKVCGTLIDSERTLGKLTPTDIDTYASILYKAGQRLEALEWEGRAFALSEGHYVTISEHFKRMQEGEPTWAIGLQSTALPVSPSRVGR